MFSSEYVSARTLWEQRLVESERRKVEAMAEHEHSLEYILKALMCCSERGRELLTTLRVPLPETVPGAAFGVMRGVRWSIGGAGVPEEWQRFIARSLERPGESFILPGGRRCEPGSLERLVNKLLAEWSVIAMDRPLGEDLDLRRAGSLIADKVPGFPVLAAHGAFYTPAQLKWVGANGERIGEALAELEREYALPGVQNGFLVKHGVDPDEAYDDGTKKKPRTLRSLCREYHARIVDKVTALLRKTEKVTSSVRTVMKLLVRIARDRGVIADHGRDHGDTVAHVSFRWSFVLAFFREHKRRAEQRTFCGFRLSFREVLREFKWLETTLTGEGFVSAYPWGRMPPRILELPDNHMATTIPPDYPTHAAEVRAGRDAAWRELKVYVDPLWTLEKHAAGDNEGLDTTMRKTARENFFVGYKHPGRFLTSAEPKRHKK